MLYGYKFNLNTQAQLRNKKNKNSYLIGYKELEGKVYKVEAEVDYKEMAEMNLFEKFIIKILREKKDIEIDVNKISYILYLDDDVVSEILKEFENIGLVSGVNSDYISLNYEGNKEFLDYDMKFYLRSAKKNYELNDLDLLEENLKNDFDKNNSRLGNYKIVDEKTASKTIYYFGYSDNSFLWYSKNKGVNSQQDFELIKNQNDNIEFTEPEFNVFCHKEEFLPYLREWIYKKTVIISTKKVNLKIEGISNKDYYLLTPDIENASKFYQEDRIFEYDFGDFVWVEDKVYVFKDDFIVEGEINKSLVKDVLIEYFIDKIKKIEPNYEKILELKEIINKNINYDEEIEKILKERSKYFKNKEERKKILKLEYANKLDELQKYPEYLKIREKILKLNKKKKDLEDKKSELKKAKEELKKLENPKILKLEEKIKQIKELK